jgi:hypothetical protein
MASWRRGKPMRGIVRLVAQGSMAGGPPVESPDAIEPAAAAHTAVARRHGPADDARPNLTRRPPPRGAATGADAQPSV